MAAFFVGIREMSRKPGRRQAANERRHELEMNIIGKIDFDRICGKEARKLIKLVKHKDFSSTKKMQDDAALLFRGIDMKMRTIQAGARLQDSKSFDEFLKALSELKTEYSQAFNRIPVDVAITEPIRVIIERQGDPPTN